MQKNRKKRSIHIPIVKEDKEEKDSNEPDDSRSAAPSPRNSDNSENGKPSQPQEKDKPADRVEEYDSLLETLQRLKAEYSNYQKRTERERQEWREACVREVFLKVLPVVDNLERAVESARQHEGPEELLSGVELILSQFHQVLASEEVIPFESAGKKFDPRFHDAVMMEETDKTPPETVVSEVLRGYMIGEKVLRAAKVIVSRKPRQAPPSEE